MKSTAHSKEPKKRDLNYSKANAVSSSLNVSSVKVSLHKEKRTALKLDTDRQRPSTIFKIPKNIKTKPKLNCRREQKVQEPDGSSKSSYIKRVKKVNCFLKEENAAAKVRVQPIETDTGLSSFLPDLLADKPKTVKNKIAVLDLNPTGTDNERLRRILKESLNLGESQRNSEGISWFT